ncbi:cystathionine gamma-synthase [Humidisolicoccus flavus]|uniref:cystathionine gamma-synthase n=1 Tax=Humidisolicoccus flavus TaxID=3111414 RepID=UPI0032434B00
MTQQHGFATRAIHDGQPADPRTGAVIPPLHFSTTYVQDGVGNYREGYEYSRAGNPTRDAFQTQLASLEGGTRAFAFPSGLSAEDSLLRAALKPGDHVLMSNDVYGGTHRLVSKIWAKWGIELSTCDFTDLDAVRAAVRPNTKMLWVETPSNPLMKITDLAAMAEIARDAGAISVADNTFATPFLQQPLSLGIDAVVHSTTKYIGGHSDILGGAVITSDAALAEEINFVQFGAGPVASPFDSWMSARSLKTLAIRVERHCENARLVAEALEGHSAVEAVYYPGLESHPGHALAASQMSGFGGMVSLAVRGGAESAHKLLNGTELFQLAESLGGIESLICYPSEMTHASVRGTELEVPENIVRLSVGIENADDLVADLLSTLDTIAS